MPYLEDPNTGVKMFESASRPAHTHTHTHTHTRHNTHKRPAHSRQDRTKQRRTSALTCASACEGVCDTRSHSIHAGFSRVRPGPHTHNATHTHTARAHTHTHKTSTLRPGPHTLRTRQDKTRQDRHDVLAEHTRNTLARTADGSDRYKAGSATRMDGDSDG